ncbi:hypothetical protein [Pseudomonas sp.]|uniref:hypothetical protein n=1 Tax=Pseudomonas sp. TaxID=306 RepID=UPI003F3F6BBE
MTANTSPAHDRVYHPERLLNVNNFVVAFLTAIVTLIGICSTNFIALKASDQSAHLKERQACIKRLDDQEASLRKQVDTFLGSLGAMVSYSESPDFSFAGAAQRYESVVKSGYSVMAFAPEDLAKQTMKLTVAVTKATSAGGSRDDADERLRAFQSEMRKWPTLYFQQMATFDKKRNNCPSN